MNVPIPIALTAKQQRICHLLAHGMTNKQIAIELGISPRTVEDHKYEIYRKYDVRTAVQLVRKIFGGGE